MVQFTIEYVALGFAILLILGGLLALFSLRSNPRAISPLQRLARGPNTPPPTRGQTQV
jgi:HAMP domain-containing protein